MFHSYNIIYTLHTYTIEITWCICVNVYTEKCGMSALLQYTEILTVCQFAGIIFLLIVHIGMTKIPSFRFYTGQLCDWLVENKQLD